MALGGGLQLVADSWKTYRLDCIKELVKRCEYRHRPTMFASNCEICNSLVKKSFGHLWRDATNSKWVCVCTECHRTASTWLPPTPRFHIDYEDAFSGITQSMGVPKAMLQKPKSLREELQTELDELLGSKAVSSRESVDPRKIKAEMDEHFNRVALASLQGVSP